ncbi:MAG: hypothetical protein QME47_03510 [Candidatus Thermoplasmatota archaeon]|nr:hypothetical protein [Candidatus Thermoplasmatota archaeon]
MKLHSYTFPYRRYRTIDKKSGKEIIYYDPMLPCRFEWKGKKTPIIDGWLDSGADSIVLPLAIAKYLGLELQDASPMRVVGGSVERFESIVDLTIGRAGRFTSFPNVKVSIPKKRTIHLYF